AMVPEARSRGALVVRLIVGLALLGWPRVGSAQGTWSVIPLPQKPGELYGFARVAVNVTGDLYVADYEGQQSPIQKRDALGNWSVIASGGGAVGQVARPYGLAVDGAGNLYVADNAISGGGNGRIQKRDAQGSWSVIATFGTAAGQIGGLNRLAADAAGNLYIADAVNQSRIQKWDAQGNWSVIAPGGNGLGQVSSPMDLAVDGA